jgi:prepilin-type N-terminal cleavage/methylation domain-containing protein
MKIRSKKGFTLVEIMIVVVIIGLLAAMAIPAFEKVRRTSVAKAMRNDARQIGAAMSEIGTEFPTTATGTIDLAYDDTDGSIDCDVDFDPGPLDCFVRNYVTKISANYAVTAYIYPPQDGDPATHQAFTISHPLVSPADVISVSTINTSTTKGTPVVFDSEGKAM